MAKKTNMNRRLTRVIIILLVIAVTVPGIIVLAEFTKSSRAKRVVAKYGDAGLLFSSNYLHANANYESQISGGTHTVMKRFFYTSDSSSCASGAITICNYAQGNTGKTCDSDITYDIEVKFVKVTSGASGYTISNATAADVGAHTATIVFKGGTPQTLNSSNLAAAFSNPYTLDHRTVATDILNVEFDADFINSGSLCLYVRATPRNAPSGIYTLESVFGAAVSVAEARNNWTGVFNDDMTQTPDIYDGFNYKISGTGTGTCTLYWDNTKVQISQEFLLSMGLSMPSGSGTVSVTFPVDSAVQNRYDLQFYYADGADRDTEYDDWDTVNGYVTLTYTES